jgi:opacity protein-like surface antigen
MWNSVNKIGGTSLSSVGQSIDLYSVPILANVTCKFTTQCGLDPYFGIGAGGVISFFEVVPSGNSDTDIEPAAQFEAGLKYQLAPNAAIGLAYKFLASVDERYYAASFNDHVTISGVYIHGVFANFTLNF